MINPSIKKSELDIIFLIDSIKNEPSMIRCISLVEKFINNKNVDSARAKHLVEEISKNANVISNHLYLKRIPKTINYSEREYPLDVILNMTKKVKAQIDELENMFKDGRC